MSPLRLPLSSRVGCAHIPTPLVGRHLRGGGSQHVVFPRDYFFRQPDHEPIRIHVVNLVRYKLQQPEEGTHPVVSINSWYGAEIVQFEEFRCSCFAWASSLLYDKCRVVISECLNR